MPRREFEKAAAIAVVLMLSARSGMAQSPPRPGADSALLAYHPPRIALVQPAEGGVLQQDRPVVVIRFAAGEPGDPVDARSFAISVDAKDQTSLFRVSATEAWGPLASFPSDLSLGSHEVAARICSARGACSSTTAKVTVASPTVTVGEAASGKDVTARRRLVDAFLVALRSLLKQ